MDTSETENKALLKYNYDKTSSVFQEHSGNLNAQK